MKKIYPDWVEKQHVKGTSIKQIRDNYYLYSVTSHYSKEKGYPVSEQRYIGKITEYSGVAEPPIPAIGATPIPVVRAT